MLSTLSKIIALFLYRKKVIDIKTIPVCKYGFEILISTFMGFLLVCISGIIFNEFLSAMMFYALFVIVRFFTGGYHADTHFKCKGNIVDYDVTATENTEVIKDLKFNTTAYATLIKSGGPIYYNSTYNNNTIKTVLGIFTNHGETDYSTWGVRITPTLARFYLSNPNIEPVE